MSPFQRANIRWFEKLLIWRPIQQSCKNTRCSQARRGWSKAARSSNRNISNSNFEFNFQFWKFVFCKCFWFVDIILMVNWINVQCIFMFTKPEWHILCSPQKTFKAQLVIMTDEMWKWWGFQGLYWFPGSPNGCAFCCGFADDRQMLPNNVFIFPTVIDFGDNVGEAFRFLIIRNRNGHSYNPRIEVTIPNTAFCDRVETKKGNCLEI